MLVQPAKIGKVGSGLSLAKLVVISAHRAAWPYCTGCNTQAIWGYPLGTDHGNCL